jgi:hypothetical protein
MLFFLAICDGIEDAGELRVEGCTFSNLASLCRGARSGCGVAG